MADRFVGVIVGFMVWLARLLPFLARLGLGSFEQWVPGKRLKVLLVGYNGARNTGADVRVVSIVEQLQESFGNSIEISIMTLDDQYFGDYFNDEVKLIKFSSIFFADVLKACSSNHIAILCEGSTLKSTFANALTLFYCQVAGTMKAQGKPCIAYGSEAGEMDAFVERIVRRQCSDTYFIARTKQSLEIIHRLNLQGHVGTDTAWTFESEEKVAWAKEALHKSGWDGTSPLIGVAPINPFWWPVKPSFLRYLKSLVTGDTRFQFEKWYFFSQSKEGEDKFEKYLNELALALNEQIQLGAHVVVIGMERLDADACNRLAALLKQSPAVFLSSDFNGYELASILRQLDCLVTSRYHACVLAMGNTVPTIAISMDERLDNIVEELGYQGDLLRHVDDSDLFGALKTSFAYIRQNRSDIQVHVGKQEENYRLIFSAMGEFLEDYTKQSFPGFLMENECGLHRTKDAVCGKPACELQ